jgi:hypothetical protein
MPLSLPEFPHCISSFLPSLALRKPPLNQLRNNRAKSKIVFNNGNP